MVGRFFSCVRPDAATQRALEELDSSDTLRIGEQWFSDQG